MVRQKLAVMLRTESHRGYGDGGEPAAVVRLGDLGHEDEDGRDVAGGRQAAQQAAHQHHGQALRETDGQSWYCFQGANGFVKNYPLRQVDRFTCLRQ